MKFCKVNGKDSGQIAHQQCLQAALLICNKGYEQRWSQISRNSSHLCTHACDKPVYKHLILSESDPPSAFWTPSVRATLASHFKSHVTTIKSSSASIKLTVGIFVSDNYRLMSSKHASPKNKMSSPAWILSVVSVVSNPFDLVFPFFCRYSDNIQFPWTDYSVSRPQVVSANNPHHSFPFSFWEPQATSHCACQSLFSWASEKAEGEKLQNDHTQRGQRCLKTFVSAERMVVVLWLILFMRVNKLSWLINTLG